MAVKYKEFIEDNFLIKNKEGVLQPFIFNATQDYYYQQLQVESPTFQGLRENILKFRQPGMSSLIDGMIVTDFILGELGEIAVTDSDIVSFRESDTQVLFTRAMLFLDSWLAGASGLDYQRQQAELEKLRNKFLKKNKSGHVIGQHGSEMHIQTAGAKVSGRGGTKQNIHWSEVAFYSNTEVINAESLVTGAEEQVPGGFGKIFRESTGNVSDDFFSREYYNGKEGRSPFRSRFFGWWIHPEYRITPPTGWEPPSYYDPVRKHYNAHISACYWHWLKTDKNTNEKRMREYPSDETEAFLMGGTPYFDKNALLNYVTNQLQPLSEAPYVQSL